MNKNFEKETKILYEQATQTMDAMLLLKKNRQKEELEWQFSREFEEAFFKLIDKVSLSLVEEDPFYAYFLFQMEKEIRIDITSPTGVNFKGAKYVLYFNPLIFLLLNMRQMESTIKHEIHHIVALHLLRAKDLKGRYSTLAINMAMDIVVNQHLEYLPPYATTLEKVNAKYHLKLDPFEPFEYYAEKLQIEIDLQEEDEEGEEDDSDEALGEKEYKPETTHDLWEESDPIEEDILRELTEKFAGEAQKGKIPAHLEEALANLKKRQEELPWNIYLKRLVGTIESHKKKTITRRNRRQPERLELRGELRHHKAQIIVALDISGSISEEEFKQAMKEVLAIVKNDKHEITIVECDYEVKREYKLKREADIKERMKIRGGTKFSPVFEYANKKKIDLLVYFTDGQGEKHLQIVPKGYKVLWVLSSRGNKLSVSKPYGVIKKLSKVENAKSSINRGGTVREGYSMNSQEPMLKM
jgi:predicted metal-dependent peptidase